MPTLKRNTEHWKLNWQEKPNDPNYQRYQRCDNNQDFQNSQNAHFPFAIFAFSDLERSKSKECNFRPSFSFSIFQTPKITMQTFSFQCSVFQLFQESKKQWTPIVFFSKLQEHHNSQNVGFQISRCILYFSILKTGNWQLKSESGSITITNIIKLSQHHQKHQNNNMTMLKVSSHGL